MRWANEHPEEMERIASLPLDEQHAALRAAMGGGELLASESTGPTVTRVCRDCGEEFPLPERLAERQSKWTSLCAFCLAGEF